MVWDILLGLFALLIGAVLLFGGYRLALILLPIWGFFAGFYVGAGALTALFGHGFLATVTGWVVGAVVGLLFAVLSCLFWHVAVVLLGASVGASIGSGLMALFGVPKYLLIVLTSLEGAGVAIAGVLLIFDVVNRAQLRTVAVADVIEESFWWSLVFFVLAAIGIVAQTAGTTTYERDAPRSPFPGMSGETSPVL